MKFLKLFNIVSQVARFQNIGWIAPELLQSSSDWPLEVWENFIRDTHFRDIHSRWRSIVDAIL